MMTSTEGEGEVAKITKDAARSVGTLLQELYGGCYSFSAILDVASTRFSALPKPINMSEARPLDRKNGSQHHYSLQFYLSRAFEHLETAEGMQSAWFASAIIQAGNALKPYNYFNRPPQLEMIYHLRNGIAHGNRFAFTPDCIARMAAHPANTAEWAASASELHAFTIEPGLQGSQVLFDFMGPGDVVDVLIAGSLYLLKLADGQIEGRRY